MKPRETRFEWLDPFGARIEEFKGEGQLVLSDEVSVPCVFDCVYLDDGRILTECHAAASIASLSLSRFTDAAPVQLEGYTTEGLHFDAEKATAQRVQFSTTLDTASKILLRCPTVNVSSPDLSDVIPLRLTYGLTNLDFLGDEVREFVTEGRRRISRDTFRFQVASTEVTVRQVTEYREMVEQMKATRSLAVTAEATLHLAGNSASLQPYDDMMDLVCTLLSLANGSRIRWVYSKLVGQDARLVSMRMIMRPSRFWVPGGALIGGATAAELKTFLAQTYEPYLREKDVYNLPVAIGYYLASKSESEWNTRFLLACIAMETLKANFAKHGKHRGSFRTLVKKMLAELKIDHTTDDLRFIKLRDKVVHTGGLGKSFRETWGAYSNLICLLDRVFVRILGYGDEYLDYADQWRLR